MKYANCSLCAKSYKYRPNKRYCSDRCRFKAWMQGKVEPDIAPCHYCGMPAEGIDRVPPRSVRPTLLAQGINTWPFKEVNACTECNSLLGDRPPWTISGRKEAIKIKLRRRYHKYLAIPEWTDSDISRMGRTMTQFIDEGLILKEAVEARLKW